MLSVFSKIRLKQLLPLVLIFSIFLVSRWYIYTYWPTNYSDVRTDYERYARMWHYGLKPYTHHQYEYPPATIPLLYLPLKYEHLGINYYHNYRFQVMIADILFFSFLTASTSQLFKKDSFKRYASLLFYIAITSLAKDFFYEGLDLMFMASIFSSFLLFIWLDSTKMAPKILIWTLFWLSTAIKFLTLPLMVPLFLIMYSQFKKDITAFFLGFLIVWGIPLIIFRSTLLVPFEINTNRPLKNASFPSYIIKLIDYQTHTETKGNKPPDFEYTGPITTVVTNTTKIIFPISILSVLLWSSYSILEKKGKKLTKKNYLQVITEEMQTPVNLTQRAQFALLLRTYGIYLFTLFFFAKIFSQPFHIWYMALLALYPFIVKRNPLIFWIPAFIMVAQDMTTLFYFPDSPDSHLFGYPYFMYGYVLKYIPMAIVYYLFLKHDVRVGNIVTHKIRK